jgi:hypothetical protein
MSVVRCASGRCSWRILVVLASTWGALSLTTAAHAQGQPTPPVAPRDRGAPDARSEPDSTDVENPAADTAASSVAPVTTTPSVTIGSGPPQPPSQNIATPLPSSSPAAPSQAVVKVGGNMILLYSNNYAPEYDAAGSRKKHTIDVWRAGIVLDAKMDRYGMHIEIRVRDRSLRWMPVNSWLEETYASVDLIKPGGSFGPLVLKLGKTFMQFGRFWDNSFYGNIHLRDGLKLDPNWGASLEGMVGAGQMWGARYFAQYYVVDGQTSTANTNRDTISIVMPGTTNTPANARRRDRIILRLEPSLTLSPTINFKLGASWDWFTVDYVDSFSDPAEAMANMIRIRDRDNTNTVMRYGVDVAGQVKWFGFWAEYTHQDGAHTNAWPIAPRADNPATAMMNEARNGQSSDDITYWLAGANFTYDRYTVQYNYSQATYKNIRALDAPGPGTPTATHKEWIHNPSASVKINDQLRFMVELPFWRRKPIPGLTTQDPTQPALGTGKEEVVEQQFLATIHGKF